MNKRTKALILMAISAILWSTAGIFIKLISWNPFVISCVRGLLSGSVLYAFMRIKGLKIKVGRNSILGGVGLAGAALLFTNANKLTTAANAIVLQFTNPVFILLIFAFVFGKKLRKGDILTVIIIMAGIVLFFMDSLTPGKLLGNLLGIASGVSIAIMYVFTGESSDDDAQRASGFLFAHIICFAVGLPFLITTPPATVTGIEIVAILELGLIQLGLSYVLYTLASKEISALACSLIGALEPLLNPVWVALFDGEVPGICALIGGIIIVVTICLWCIYDAKASAKEASLEAGSLG